MAASHRILTLSCADRPGIVAAVAAHIAGSGGNILESSQFNDKATDRFFLRTAFALSPGADPDALGQGFEALVDRFGMQLALRPADVRQRVLLLVSRHDHCLVDLLYRQRIGELDMEVVGIVSNHGRPALGSADFGAIPFHHLPVTPESRARQEAQLLALIAATRTDLVVLARYMQILSDATAAALAGRAINIHHSFLPSFKGARPYHQAHARGVKLIGATAHYVTSALDEGPIIEQDVERISHADTADDLIRKGRDIERRVLARAVGLHLAGRVLLNGNRTVVFRD
jgi:formyltetrahydrofolate deformylase